MPGFRETFRADMVASGCERRGILAGIWYFLTRYDYSAVLFFRLSSTCYAMGHKPGRLLAMIFWRLNTLMNACDIRPQAIIGPGLNLPHPVGVIIGYMVVMGKNASIYQNVTMGRRQTDDAEDKLDPIIVGDNVSVYSGAVLLGGAIIGDGSEVGANSVVMKEIPAGSLAFGVPARVVGKVRAVAGVEAPAEAPVAKPVVVVPVVAQAPVLSVVENNDQPALFTDAEMEKAGLRSRPAAVDGEQRAGDVRRSVAG